MRKKKEKRKSWNKQEKEGKGEVYLERFTKRGGKEKGKNRQEGKGGSLGWEGGGERRS